MSGRKSERVYELRSRMYCIFTHIVFFYKNPIFHLDYKGIPCLQDNHFELSLSVKIVMQEKQEEGTPLKDVVVLQE